MNRGGITVTMAAVALAACGSDAGKLTIRSLPTTVAPGRQPLPFRIAEAQGYLRLGNVALALESFRKARREDPASVEALNGLAVCYDRMGRFDVSRRYYEEALALAPADAGLYANFALSLDLQGKRAEAATVRQEMQQRLAATAPNAPAGVIRASTDAAPIPPIQAAPAAHAAAPTSVAPPAVRLPAPLPATPVSVASEVAAQRPAPTPEVVVALMPPAIRASATLAPSFAMPRPAQAIDTALPKTATTVPSAATGPRLERLSLGEVALVTTARPIWKAQVVASSSRSTTITFSKAAKAAPAQLVLLLNAARIDRLAARTRSLLANRGWQRLTIGNAHRPQRSSVILYPPGQRAAAERLGRHLGVLVRLQPGHGERIIVLLGRDSIGRGGPAIPRA